MKTRFRVACFAAVVLLLCGRALAESEIDLVLEVPKDVEGSTAVTFWMVKQPFGLATSNAEFATLKPEGFHFLVDGSRIEAPPGISVTQSALDVSVQNANYTYRINRTETTINYKENVVRGRWTLTASPNAPLGPFQVLIHLPGVASVRDGFGAVLPEGESSIVLSGTVFRTATSRAATRWWDEFISGVGYLLLVTVGIALTIGGVCGVVYARSFHALFFVALGGVVAWGTTGRFLLNLGSAIEDLNAISPMWGIAATVGVNVAYFVFFRLVSGGRWNYVWTLCLACGIAYATAWFFIGDLISDRVNQAAPKALLAMLPGLCLAFVCSAAYKKPDELKDPLNKQGLEDVRAYMRKLPARE